MENYNYTYLIEILRELLLKRYQEIKGISYVITGLPEPEIRVLYEDIEGYYDGLDLDTIVERKYSISLTTVRRIIQRKYKIKTEKSNGKLQPHHKGKPILDFLCNYLNQENWEVFANRASTLRIRLRCPPDKESVALFRELELVVRAGKNAELDYYRKGNEEALEQVKKYFDFEALEIIIARRKFFEESEMTMSNSGNPSSYTIMDIFLSGKGDFPRIELTEQRFMIWYYPQFKEYREYYSSVDMQSIFFKKYSGSYKIICMHLTFKHPTRLPLEYNNEYYFDSSLPDKMINIYSTLFEALPSEKSDFDTRRIKSFFEYRKNYFERKSKRVKVFDDRRVQSRRDEPILAKRQPTTRLYIEETPISNATFESQKKKKTQKKKKQVIVKKDDVAHLPPGIPIEIPFDTNTG